MKCNDKAREPVIFSLKYVSTALSFTMVMNARDAAQRHGLYMRARGLGMSLPKMT
jgi:hypothetical protein